MILTKGNTISGIIPQNLESFIFVPGIRTDLYRKAVKTGCDIVCLELEDGIAPQDKTSARDKVIEFLGRNTNEDNNPEQVIRVNQLIPQKE